MSDNFSSQLSENEKVDETIQPEASVLDFVKSILTPWRGKPLQIPAPENHVDRLSTTSSFPTAPEKEISVEPVVDLASEAISIKKPFTEVVLTGFPWRLLLGVGFALAAQRALIAGPNRTWQSGVVLFFIAAVCLVWSEVASERKWNAHTRKEANFNGLVIRKVGLYFGIPCAVLGFIASGGNLFTSINLFLILSALISLLGAFWQPHGDEGSWFQNLYKYISSSRLTEIFSPWNLVVLMVLGIVIFFRFYRLNQVPPEMTSDHAEKIFDIIDILKGQPHIFFPRNSGREGLQFYLAAFISQVLGTGLSFTTLKLSTIVVGFLTLPYLYGLGKIVGNRRVALITLAFTGIAYWPNVVSRVGMRLPFYFLFTAVILFYLVRGLHSGRRNDFIWAGIALGLGFYGYSADRILPLLVLLAVVLYLFHNKSAYTRRQVFFLCLVLVLFALVIALPMIRYAVEEPQMFFYRTLTRMGTLERPLDAPVWRIFFGNLWNALTMFSWSAGEVWATSVPYAPALGIVSGGLFHLGIVLTFIRYIRKRDWFDLFLLLSIPLLMLPSILSLAFPNENPNLYRTGGVLIPVFLIIALSLDEIMIALESGIKHSWKKKFAWGFALVLFVFSSFQDYDLVFNQYQRNYALSSWNTSEIGQVIRSFADSVGTIENTYVVGYPHWVDTRLVAINAGYPGSDFAIWPEQFPDTLVNHQAKLFIVHPTDTISIEKLRALYPSGFLQLFSSKVENKDFWLFFVPPQQ